MQSQNTANLRIWDALGKTDPKHTKAFSRPGGFKGTAIKPMWSFQRMTEFFGPCGIGWGPDKPSFETREAGAECLVFCTVGLWYVDGEAKGQVYGVGGDKYWIKQGDGMRSSDEAFKAAYTDALSNAMKLIGVAADVHMGLFDDNKYVREMTEEFSDAPKQDAKAPKTTIISKKAADMIRNGLKQRIADGKVTQEAVVKALAGLGLKSVGEIEADRVDEVVAVLEGL